MAQINQNDIVQVEYIENIDYRYRPVFKLKNSKNNIICYIKLTNKNELYRTRLFCNIINSKNLLSKYKDIEIEFSKVLDLDFYKLPLYIQEYITNIINKIFNINGFRKSKDFLQEFLFITAVDTSGINLENLQIKLDKESYKIFNQSYNENDYQFKLKEKFSKIILNYLDNKCISTDEWICVKAFINDLHKYGFQHSDLYHNMFIKRSEKTNKLKITLIDFDLETDAGSDDFVIEIWQTALKKYGILI